MSLKLLLVIGLAPLILARPDTYKETEDFQYSRSDSDHGQKSGFYAAQRGNMGGNYEKSHNMDNLAQNQMTDLAQQVSRQLGAGGSSNGHGSLYGSASASGSTRLNQQHLAGQGGLGSSRSAGARSGGYTQHGALRSQNQNQLGYGEEYYGGSADRQSHETQQAYETQQRLLSSSSQMNSQAHSTFGSGSETSDAYQQTVVKPVYPGQSVHLAVRPGRVMQVVVPVRAQTGYDAQSQYTGATLSSAGSTYNRQSATANTEFLNENSEGTGQRGRLYYSGANGQTADDLATSQYNQREDDSSSQAQNLNTGRTSRYQYGYNKQWERHGTVIPNTAQTEIGSVGTSRASNVRNLQTDYNVINHNTDDQAVLTGSRQGHSHTYGNQWERHGSRTIPSTSVNHLTRTDGRNINLEEQTVGTTNLQSASSTINQAQRTHKNFNTATASQALEAGTAYNTDVELLNENQNIGTNLDLGSRTVTNAPKRFESSYSYHKSWERKGTPYVIQPSSSGLTTFNGGASTNEGESQLHRATDQSSGQRAYYTKGGSRSSTFSGSSSHSTGINSQNSLTENMARLQENLQQQQERMKASLCDDECASSKSNKYESSYSYSRQHSYRKKRSSAVRQSNDYEYEKNYEDMGQQLENFGQMPEDLGQMPEDFGQQSEDFGQTPEKFGQLPENLNQMPVDFSHLTESNQASKLGKNLGEHQVETNSNHLYSSRTESHTGINLNKNPQEKTLGEQLVETDYNNKLQSQTFGVHTTQEKTLGEQLVERDYKKLSHLGQPMNGMFETYTPRNTQEKTLGEQLVERDYKKLSQLGQPMNGMFETYTPRNTQEKTLGEQLVERDYKKLSQLGQPMNGMFETYTPRNTQEKTLGEQLVERDYKKLSQLGQPMNNMFETYTPKNTLEKTLGEQLVETDYKALLQFGQPTYNKHKILADVDYESPQKSTLQFQQTPSSFVTFDEKIFDNFFDDLHKQPLQVMHNLHNANFGEHFGNFEHPKIGKPHSYNDQVSTSASFEKPPKITFDDSHYDNKYKQYSYIYKYPDDKILDFQKGTPKTLDKPEETENIDHLKQLNNIDHINTLSIDRQHIQPIGNTFDKIYTPVMSFLHEHHNDRESTQYNTHARKPTSPTTIVQNQTNSASIYMYNHPSHYVPFVHTAEFHNNPTFSHNSKFHHNPAFHHNYNPIVQHNPAFHQESSNSFVLNTPFQFTSPPHIFSYPFQSTLISTTTQKNQNFGKSSLENDFVEHKTVQSHVKPTNVATTEVSYFDQGIRNSNEPKNNPSMVDTDKLLESIFPDLMIDNKENRNNKFNTYSTGHTVVSYNYSESNVQHFLVPSSTPKNKLNNYYPESKQHSTTQKINVEIGDNFRNPTTEVISNFNDKYNRNTPKEPRFKTPAEIEMLSLVRDQNESLSDEKKERARVDKNKERARGDIPTIEEGDNKLFQETTTKKTLVYSGDALVFKPNDEKLPQNVNLGEDLEHNEQNLEQEVEDFGQQLESFNDQMEEIVPFEIENTFKTTTEKTLLHSAYSPVTKPKNEKPKQTIYPKEDTEQYEQNLELQLEDLGQQLESFNEQMEEVAPVETGNIYRETTENTFAYFSYGLTNKPKTLNPKQKVSPEDDKEQYDEQNLDQQIEDLGQELVSFDKQKEDTVALQIGNNHEKPVRTFISDQNDMDWSIGRQNKEHETSVDNHKMPKIPKEQFPKESFARKPLHEQFNHGSSSSTTKAILSEVDNLEQQIEVGQEIEDFNWEQQKPVSEYNADLASNTLTKIDSKPNKNDKKTDNEMFFNIDKILNDELMHLETENNNFKQHENEQIRQESSTRAQVNVITESIKEFEQLGHQPDKAAWDQEIEKIQRQYDQVEEALDKYEHPHEKPHPEKFSLDARSKLDVINNDNKPTLTSPLQEGEKIKDDSDQRVLEAAPTEGSKPGFWQNMKNKYSKTKDTIKSWFS